MKLTRARNIRNMTNKPGSHCCIICMRLVCIRVDGIWSQAICRLNIEINNTGNYLKVAEIL